LRFDRLYWDLWARVTVHGALARGIQLGRFCPPIETVGPHKIRKAINV
jgi:hypothetical protein